MTPRNLSAATAAKPPHTLRTAFTPLLNLQTAAMSKFYLTTPIYYVNARPHIGHAYTTIAADTLARRKRIEGLDTYFLTGTDEHGQKIGRSAAAAGIPPQQFTDEVSETFRSLWQRMGISYDQYIRTTDEKHKRGVQKLFRALYEKGAIYLDRYTGAYCVSDEAFVDVPVGTPCPDCGRITEEVTEENFFFRLSQYQVELIDLISDGRFEIQPEARKNEVLSFLRGPIERFKSLGDTRDVESGPSPKLDDVILREQEIRKTPGGIEYLYPSLKDLSISRTSFDWGIPVPEEILVAEKTTQRHVVYVWLDALANYMTAVGYGDETAEGTELFERYWPANLHFVGKEIVRFHCVYWPAFLLAAKIDLPEKIVAHGWLLLEESKMSKSRGNIVRSETILDAFGPLRGDLSKEKQDLFASDVLRHFLLGSIHFGADGNFSLEELRGWYNSQLGNSYGNLIKRIVTPLFKHFGRVPGGHPDGWTAQEESNFQDWLRNERTRRILESIDGRDHRSKSFFSDELASTLR